MHDPDAFAAITNKVQAKMKAPVRPKEEPESALATKEELTIHEHAMPARGSSDPQGSRALKRHLSPPANTTSDVDVLAMKSAQSKASAPTSKSAPQASTSKASSPA